MPSVDQAGESGGGRGLSTRHGRLVVGGRTLVMGILNVTPDSFSDGGLYFDERVAIEQGLRLAADGADLLDVGGESTRPGSRGVEPAEQIRRTVPVIRGLRAARLTLAISIDTQVVAVAAAALEAGADIVNDVSGARHDAAMPELLRRERVPFVCMHMQGTPETMQQAPRYENVVEDVLRFFDERAAALSGAGVDCSRMIVDPGIGFGKTVEHNLAILREIGRFVGRGTTYTAGGWPVLVGPSRKAFISKTLGNAGPAALLAGTAATALHCALAGVDLLRVHDVRAIKPWLAAGRA